MATNVDLNDLTDYWQDGATQTLPTYSELTSTGFAQSGDPVAGIMATRPGSAWFNLVAAMRVSVIRAAGLTPSQTPDPLQFLKALQSLAWLNDKSIATSMLADGLINAAKLAASAVETEKLKDLAVTATKLASGAVETDKLKDLAVTAAKIAEATITFSKIASGAIATDEEARAGVANDKFMTPYLVKMAIDAFTPPACPTGMVSYFGLDTVPEGWLICNGANVSRTTYAALFAAIGTRFGAGDGSTTFTLPNLHERFIEGTTTTSQVGTKLEAGLPNITGEVGETLTYTGSPTTGAFELELGEKTYAWDTGQGQVAYPKLYASRSSSIYGGSDSVQPSSLQLLPCIKS